MTASSPFPVRGLHGVHQVLRVVLVAIVLLGRGCRLLHVRRVVAGHVGCERRECGRLADRADRARGHQVAEPEPVVVPAEPQHGEHGGQRHHGQHEHFLDHHHRGQYGQQQRLDDEELERGQQREQQRVLFLLVLAPACNLVNHCEHKVRLRIAWKSTRQPIGRSRTRAAFIGGGEGGDGKCYGV